MKVLPYQSGQIAITCVQVWLRMPFCKCHSFASLESQSLPILSHADIAELVLLSALELVPLTTQRTDEERRMIHDKVMKLQEEFLSKIGKRIRTYEEVIRSQCFSSQREWNRYE
jgi:hypothetical protein